MPLVKVSELEGTALDWAVAKCEGRPYTFEVRTGGGYNGNTTYGHTRDYSSDWAQGGPIIEREEISLDRFGDYPNWESISPSQTRAVKGPTPLIAAMRCYVASKLGESIEIPKELT